MRAVSDKPKGYYMMVDKGPDADRAIELAKELGVKAGPGTLYVYFYFDTKEDMDAFTELVIQQEGNK